MPATQSTPPRGPGLPKPSPGLLVSALDAGYDGARSAWNLAVDQRPAFVATPKSEEEVGAVVRFARENGLRVAPQGTGHGAAGLAPLESAVLVRTSQLRTISIDAERRVARAGAGSVWQHVIAPAGASGLAVLAGSSADVGIVGYALGGGVGWLARRHGLAVNSIRAVEIVLHDGRSVRVDHQHESDLFWALRGAGGGSFGVVTAVELDLVPEREAHAGALFWPFEQAREVLHAYCKWATEAPEDVTASGRLLQLPPLPELPDHLRGQKFAVVEAVILGDERRAAAILEPLRRLRPALDTFATMPVSELSRLHMDPDHPVPALGDGALLGSLPPDGVDAVLAVAGPGSHSPLLSLELRQLGGALGRAPANHGALGSLVGDFVMFAVGIAPDAADAALITERLGAVERSLSPWMAEYTYLPFAERSLDASAGFDPATYARLRRVKAHYDPDDLFQGNHPVVLPGPDAVAG